MVRLLLLHHSACIMMRSAWFVLPVLVLSGCLRYQFVAPLHTTPEQWQRDMRECLRVADLGRVSYNNLPTSQVPSGTSLTNVDAYLGCMQQNGYRIQGEHWSLSASDQFTPPPTKSR